MHASVNWNERVVSITGGTAGIGLALAEAFLGEGARVAVCGRSPEALEAFRRLYPSALAVKADVTVVAEQTMLLDTVTERFGKLDILVSNAGQLIERDFAAGLSDMIAFADEITLNLDGTGPIDGSHIGALAGPRGNCHRKLRLRPGVARASTDLRRRQGGPARFCRGASPAARETWNACLGGIASQCRHSCNKR